MIEKILVKVFQQPTDNRTRFSEREKRTQLASALWGISCLVGTSTPRPEGKTKFRDTTILILLKAEGR
jgi:hypothetical protein